MLSCMVQAVCQRAGGCSGDESTNKAPAGASATASLALLISLLILRGLATIPMSSRLPCAPQVSLFGIVQLQGRHLPFAFVALDLLMGQNVWPDILGILMGHV